MLARVEPLDDRRTITAELEAIGGVPVSEPQTIVASSEPALSRTLQELRARPLATPRLIDLIDGDF